MALCVVYLLTEYGDGDMVLLLSDRVPIEGYSHPGKQSELRDASRKEGGISPGLIGEGALNREFVWTAE